MSRPSSAAAAANPAQLTNDVTTYQELEQKFINADYATVMECLGSDMCELPDEILTSFIREVVFRICNVNGVIDSVQHGVKPQALSDEVATLLQNYLSQVLSKEPVKLPINNPRLEETIKRLFSNMLEQADCVIWALTTCEGTNGDELLGLYYSHLIDALGKTLHTPNEDEQHEVAFYLAYFSPNPLNTYLRSLQWDDGEITDRFINLVNTVGLFFNVPKDLLLYRQPELLKDIFADLENDDLLENFVASPVINHTAPEGTPYAGESIAFWMVRHKSSLSRNLLRANNCQLANQIEQNTLNAIIKQGPDAGQSVAFWLANATEDPAGLLTAQAEQIAADTLNQIIPEGEYAGDSLAMQLAYTPNGLAILAADQHRLAKLITSDTLNTPIKQGPLAGVSVAFWLTQSIQGQRILAINDHQLAKLIKPETLDITILYGLLAGHSAASNLQQTPEGQAILAVIHATNADIPKAVAAAEAQEDQSSPQPSQAANPDSLFSENSRKRKRPDPADDGADDSEDDDMPPTKKNAK